MDREEFQHGNVSKREVSDLFNELFSDFDINAWDFKDIHDTLTFDGTSSKQATEAQNLNQSLITPIKQADEQLENQNESLVTPEPYNIESQSPASIQSPNRINFFGPSAVSTPAKLITNNNSISPAQQPSYDSFNSTLLSVNDVSQQKYMPYPVTPYAYSPQSDAAPTFVPTMSFTTNSVASSNAALPYSSILIHPMPPGASTTPTIPSTVLSTMQTNNNDIDQLNRQIVAGPAPKKSGTRSKKSRFKNIEYTDLLNFNPNAIQPKVS